MPTPRQVLACAVGRLIQQSGGVVTSLLPPPGGGNVIFETPPPLTERIPEVLRTNGYKVVRLGSTQRLDPHAVREEVHYRLETGQDAVRVVTSPGLADLTQFEVLIPSDQELGQRVIPSGGPSPRKSHGATHWRPSEQEIQKAIFQHLRVRGVPDLFAFHVPNGGYRRRTEGTILNDRRGAGHSRNPSRARVRPRIEGGRRQAYANAIRHHGCHGTSRRCGRPCAGARCGLGAIGGMGAVAGKSSLATMWSMADRRDANCATAHRNIAMAAAKMALQWTTVSIEITRKKEKRRAAITIG